MTASRKGPPYDPATNGGYTWFTKEEAEKAQAEFIASLKTRKQQSFFWPIKSKSAIPVPNGSHQPMPSWDNFESLMPLHNGRFVAFSCPTGIFAGLAVLDAQMRLIFQLGWSEETWRTLNNSQGKHFRVNFKTSAKFLVEEKHQPSYMKKLLQVVEDGQGNLYTLFSHINLKSDDANSMAVYEWNLTNKTCAHLYSFEVQGRQCSEEFIISKTGDHLHRLSGQEGELFLYSKAKQKGSRFFVNVPVTTITEFGHKFALVNLHGELKIFENNIKFLMSYWLFFTDYVVKQLVCSVAYMIIGYLSKDSSRSCIRVMGLGSTDGRSVATGLTQKLGAIAAILAISERQFLLLTLKDDQAHLLMFNAETLTISKISAVVSINYNPCTHCPKIYLGANKQPIFILSSLSPGVQSICHKLRIDQQEKLILLTEAKSTSKEREEFKISSQPRF